MVLSFFPWQLSDADIANKHVEQEAGRLRADEVFTAIGTGLPSGTLSCIVGAEEFSPDGTIERAFLDRLQERMETQP